MQGPYGSVIGRGIQGRLGHRVSGFGVLLERSFEAPLAHRRVHREFNPVRSSLVRKSVTEITLQCDVNTQSPDIAARGIGFGACKNDRSVYFESLKMSVFDGLVTASVLDQLRRQLLQIHVQII
jgi:hypothetical protein